MDNVNNSKDILSKRLEADLLYKDDGVLKPQCKVKYSLYDIMNNIFMRNNSISIYDLSFTLGADLFKNVDNPNIIAKVRVKRDYLIFDMDTLRNDINDLTLWKYIKNENGVLSLSDLGQNVLADYRKLIRSNDVE